MLSSDVSSEKEMTTGLDSILEDFKRKREFLLEVKQNNKN